MKTIIRLIGCMLPVLIVSCSIKEDRSVCPCLINMDYSSVLSDERLQTDRSRDSLLVIVRGQHNGLVRMSDYPEGQPIYVKRTRSLLSCYLGMSEGRLQNGRSRLVIPLGEDCDRLFSYHRTLDLDEGTDEEYVTPVMCYEYTRVILSYARADSRRAAELTFRAVGGTSALDLSTGEPLEGDFRCVMELLDDRSWAFNMPRQRTRDIRIEAADSFDGKVLFTVDLSAELDRAGYEWDAASLAPLVIVEVSEQNLPVGVRIMDWDEAIYFDYTL